MKHGTLFIDRFKTNILIAENEMEQIFAFHLERNNNDAL